MSSSGVRLVDLDLPVVGECQNPSEFITYLLFFCNIVLEHYQQCVFHPHELTIGLWVVGCRGYQIGTKNAAILLKKLRCELCPLGDGREFHRIRPNIMVHRNAALIFLFSIFRDTGNLFSDSGIEILVYVQSALATAGRRN